LCSPEISRFFALVQTLVGGFEKFGSGKAVDRVNRKTDTDRECWRVGLLAQTTSDAPGDVLRAFAVGVQKQNGELIPAIARGNFRCAAVILHHAGQAIQGAVPGQMAAAVIDGFQIVEIAVCVRPDTPLFQAREEFPIVGKSCLCKPIELLRALIPEKNSSVESAADDRRSSAGKAEKTTYNKSSLAFWGLKERRQSGGNSQVANCQEFTDAN
jgi:hypothetical protein